MYKLFQCVHAVPHRKNLVFLLLLLLSSSLVNAQEIVASTNEIPVEDAEPWWVWVFLGRLHPLIVHFPIALIVIGGIMEISKIGRFQSNLRTGTNWMVFIGTAGAIFATVLGLILGNTGSYAGENFEWHQWFGISTAIMSGITAISLWIILKYKQNKLIIVYRIGLFLAVFSVFLTGHYGGSLTHGEGYLLSTTPWASDEDELSEFAEGMPASTIDLASFTTNPGDTLSLEQQVNLNIAARTIFAHHCYQCHSSDKTEGELRLDEKDLVFKGGESGAVIQPGDAEGSELVRRITLPAGHKEAMPTKGKKLGENEIEVIKLWINQGAPWPDQAKGIFRVAPLAPRLVTLPAAEAGLTNPIDLLVNAYFKKNKFQWPESVDDRTYLRRVYFDIIGLPASEQDIQRFLADPAVDKRERLVTDLLSNNHAYATHWTTFWNDLLRNDYTGTGYITNGRFNISAWLYQSLVTNKSYQQFAKELLNPTEESKGFIKGIEWRGAVNSSQTTAMQAAQNVSQALLGVNLKCASCHDSFVSDWKLDDAYAFANIFSETALEINRCDVPTGKMADTRLLWPELGSVNKAFNVQQRSQQLADSLTLPSNGRLYRTIVNRVWAQMLGRGIVSPTDEMDKKPWSEDLIDWLAVHFVDEGYDIKKLIYLIATSKTYQLPSSIVEDPSSINSEKFVFNGHLKRKLTAEQFADAVSQLVHPLYGEAALKYNPFGDPQAYLQSSNFVRAALVQNDPFLTALGRPSRENITSVREGQATLLQAMELTNGTKLNETLVQASKQWVTKFTNPQALVEAIYLQTLGRNVNDAEHQVALKLFANEVKEDAVQELLWAIVLLPEFQFIE